VDRIRFVGRLMAVASASGLLLAGFAGNSWAAASPHKHHASTSSASRCRTYQVAGKRIRVCNGLNGKQGPSGPSGPTGPGGPSGPSGANGAPGNGAFGGVLRAGTAATTLFNQNGALIEAACSTNDGTTLAVRPEGAEGNHNTVSLTTFTEAGVTTGGSPFEAGNERVLVLNEYAATANGLIAVRTSTGAITTIQWFAMPSSDGDCIVGGTAAY
jgi:hypothetical protein